MDLKRRSWAALPLRRVPVLAFLGLACVAAKAHNGPPFPIISDRQIGSVRIAVWTHPDIGTGTFFVLVDPVPGHSVPGDLKLDLGIQPVDKRLREVLYPMERVAGQNQVQYNAQVQFDRQDYFKVRVRLRSSGWNGEATSQVEATPQGFGRWDLLFYLLPFLLIAAMFYRGVRRKRREMRNV